MFRRVRPLLMIVPLVVAFGCHSPEEQRTPPAAEASSPLAAPSSFPATLDGQLDRIDSQGGRSVDAVLDNWESSWDVGYSMLEKNPNKYAGTAFTFYGKIVQIQENEGFTRARICFSDDFDAIIYVEGRFSTPYLKNQYVNVVGYLAGNHTYTSQANWTVTIPALAARAIFSKKERKPYDDLYFKRHGNKPFKFPKAS